MLWNRYAGKLATCLLVLSIAGCRPASQAGVGVTRFQGEYPIQVTATVGMVADVVRHVGGEHVQVTQLLGPGVDPHLYNATRDDVARLQQSDIVFYCGLMLEGKMADTLEKVARSKPVYAVAEAIDASRLLQPEGFAGHPDPHVWMDVGLWAETVDVVADALSSFDPKHAKDYSANAAAYRSQVVELDEYAKNVLATIPESQRVLITSHDAFNYFGRAYGLSVEGVQGISTLSEAGTRRINQLVDMIVSRGVSAVFVESSVPRKTIEALIRGAQSRGQNVKVGGELFSDAMGAAGTYEGTYIGMMDHNITVVARALGGDAPAGGMQGKLANDASP